MDKVQALKGFRDFLPEEAKKREYVLSILKKVFDSYGFEPLETPALEYDEILLGKYGDEGEKLMYRFEDLGGRKVAMRYDQTVPLARVVAQYQNELPLPFKRYQIQPVWRAENTQKGRYREFLQVDIDTVGSTSLVSDGEVIKLVIEAFEKLRFKDIKFLVNDRKIFDGISNDAIISLDKLKKIGEDEVVNELVKKGYSDNDSRLILDKLIKSPPTSAILELQKIVDDKRLEYSSTLARGLSYYTGLIFEVESEKYSGGSLGGGGRYDNLIGMFAKRDIPAVGFSFGFDRIIEAMEELDLFPKDLNRTRILVTNTNDNALRIADELRKKGINTEMYIDEKDLDKQLKYADKKKIPYVLIFDDDKLLLKDMKTGEQKSVNEEDVPSLVLA